MNSGQKQTPLKLTRVSDCCLTPEVNNYPAISLVRTNYIWDDAFLDEHSQLHFNSASSLKQFRASQCLFWVFNGKVANGSLRYFGEIWQRLESTLYCTRCQHPNHYITDARDMLNKHYQQLIYVYLPVFV